MKKLYIFLTTVCLSIVVRTAHAQAGALDTAFSADGKVITALSNGDNQALGVAIQADGKILAAGYAFTNSFSNDIALVRYNPDGTPDNTFGNNGVVITGIGTGSDKANAITLQPDGKIILAGVSNTPTNDNDFLVLRYNSNGTPDKSFGYNGTVVTSLGAAYEHALSVAVQADGKLVVGGLSYGNMANQDFALIRYNANGTIDKSFGYNGVVKTDLALSNNYLYSVLVKPNGKILAAGTTDTPAGEDMAVVCYNSDGSIDQTYGNQGFVIKGIGPGDDRAYAAALQLDGKLVLAGTSYSGTNFDFAVMRLDTNGNLDQSFGLGGKIITPIGANDMAYALSLQRDDKIVVAGTSIGGGGSQFALVRYNINGTPDDEFDFDGILTTTFGGTANEAYGVAIQDDGKIIAAGGSMTSHYNFALVRYISNINLGVTDRYKHKNMSVFYNTENFEVIVNGTEDNGEMNVCDITGKRISGCRTAQGKTTLNTGPVAPGVYLLNYTRGANSSSFKLAIP